MKKRLLSSIIVLAATVSAFAQTTLTGRITDARTGEPLIGASLVPKSSKELGAVTDIDGNFKLVTNVELPLTLSVQFIGYRSQEVDVYDASEPVDIQLIDASDRLNEVVIIGYGAQKRLELTSSISTVNQELLKQNSPSVESALQGAVAGLNVTTTSGQPGAASIIRIRGGNSITGGNEPLFVIDGVIVYNDVASNKTGARGSDAALDPLSFLNPSDIESIEVLKDVAATAIYGTRGANGVIIITTKKGSHGRNNISYSASFGWSSISKKLDYLNAWQWADLWNELYENGEVGYRLDEPTASYDWQDAALQTGFSQEHQLSVVGGDEISRYSISGSYKNQEGILLNTGLKRYAARINYERNVFKNLLAPEFRKEFVQRLSRIPLQRIRRTEGLKAAVLPAVAPRAVRLKLHVLQNTTKGRSLPDAAVDDQRAAHVMVQDDEHRVFDVVSGPKLRLRARMAVMIERDREGNVFAKLLGAQAGAFVHFAVGDFLMVRGNDGFQGNTDAQDRGRVDCMLLKEAFERLPEPPEICVRPGKGAAYGLPREDLSIEIDHLDAVGFFLKIQTNGHAEIIHHRISAGFPAAGGGQKALFPDEPQLLQLLKILGDRWQTEPQRQFDLLFRYRSFLVYFQKNAAAVGPSQFRRADRLRVGNQFHKLSFQER